MSASSLPPEVDRLIAALLAGQQTILGDKLAGLYLSGSLVWGDYDAEISDVDLVAVITSELTAAEFARLEAMHLAVMARESAPAHRWDDRVEILYVAAAALRSFRTHPHELAVISPGEPFHRLTAGLDWLMNWYLVQTHGNTCFGPPPSTWIDPIAQAEFVDAVRDHARALPGWLDTLQELPWQSYTILTLCRALYTHHLGEQVSKEKAAAWVGQRWPAWADLVDQALIWRKDRTAADPVLTFPRTCAFVHFAAAQIDRGTAPLWGSP
jgi:hypothetical protein